jgi:YggT family protein
MNQVVVFLIEVLFAIPIYMLLARFFLQGFRAPFTDQAYQWLLLTLNPVLRPLEQVIPRFRSWNLACLVLLYLVCVLKALALLGLVGIGALLAYGLAVMLSAAIGMFMFLVFIRIILSFVQANPNNAIVPLVYRLTEPLLAPLRRILPAAGPIDFSPMLLFLIFLLLNLLIVLPLQDWVARQVLVGAMLG